MKLKGKDRQKIRSALRKLGIRIEARGRLDPYCFLYGNSMIDILDLGAELYYDPVERCLKIRNWLARSWKK